MKLVALILLISSAFAWFAMQKPQLIENSSDEIRHEKVFSSLNAHSKEHNPQTESNIIASCSLVANEMDSSQWGAPYDEQYQSGLANSWREKNTLNLSELLSLAEHGDAIAMLRVAQLAFDRVLPNQGFVRDKTYQEQDATYFTRIEKSVDRYFHSYDQQQVFALGVHWAEQAAFHGKIYGLNLLARVYLSKLMQSDKPKAQWLVNYFTYTQLWHEQAGQALENHSMLELLKDSEQHLQAQITLAKQDFHQQRLQLGLVSPNQC
ncbi:hypothetical protein HF888_00440 [Bermanella marisrubri]|uniref:DUF4034 domain-containing protein n=1 Tax=Bermanella marisrubri TaxID=207949 RepID=Q1N3X7_9GAMM|nr:hypothetical protein [Bermanella marisrubri]EAT13088.1 hypothetical protein RED65_15367 [Oceanobacter sp. RED65] [Bermanella marisrubri]QIZ82797.1 hypothetical protein HF888_00440 [Bermanella marisrubri]